jgi:hypothetical protein
MPVPLRSGQRNRSVTYTCEIAIDITISRNALFI